MYVVSFARSEGLTAKLPGKLEQATSLDRNHPDGANAIILLFFLLGPRIYVDCWAPNACKSMFKIMAKPHAVCSCCTTV